MTTAKPHPLKGILNTNDDPMACAVCSAPAQTYKCYTIMICCGKDLCDACLPKSETSTCPLCKSSGVSVGTLKKYAKKGAPWAQHELGLSYRKGDSVRQSDEDANRWQEKAAKSRCYPVWSYNPHPPHSLKMTFGLFSRRFLSSVGSLARWQLLSNASLPRRIWCDLPIPDQTKSRTRDVSGNNNALLFLCACSLLYCEVV